MTKPLSKKDIKGVFVETLEPFARSVQGDFKKVHNRLSGIEKEVSGVEDKVLNIDVRLAGVEFEVKELKNEMREMKETASELFTKLDKFIALYEAQRQEMVLLNTHVHRLEERIEKLEQKNSRR